MTFPTAVDLDEFEADWQVVEQAYNDPLIRDLAEAIEAIERANDRLESSDHDPRTSESETHDAVIQASVYLHGAVDERLGELAEQVDTGGIEQ